ncbi:hypothetical protein D3C85_1869930 [compost metagenome]
MVAHLHDEVHRREQLACIRGRAYIRAAAAFHTCVQIDQLLLRELFNRPNTVRFGILILQINRLQLARGRTSAKP